MNPTVSCFNCKHVTQSSCKGCNTIGFVTYQNFQPRKEFAEIKKLKSEINRLKRTK